MCIEDVIGEKAEMLGMVVGVIVGVDWETWTLAFLAAWW